MVTLAEYVCIECGCIVTPESYYDPKYKQETYVCPECESVTHTLSTLFILHTGTEEKI